MNILLSQLSVDLVYTNKTQLIPSEVTETSSKLSSVLLL